MDIDIMNSFGLLFMTISANFTGNLLSCGIQRTFTQSMLVKHLIALGLLFFFIVLTNKDLILKKVKQGDIVLPYFITNTLSVYLVFLLCTRMNLIYTSIILIATVIYMLLDLEKANKSKEQSDHLERAKDVVQYITIVIGVVGFYHYLIKQWVDHQGSFSWRDFLLGTTQCRL